MPLRPLALRALTVTGERELTRAAPIYPRLRASLEADGVRFLVPPPGDARPWRETLFLNLAFWGGPHGDVLESERVPADAVAHAAWHHLTRRALGPGPPTADALFLGEAIASAFDLYLVGQLVRHAPRAAYLAAKLPALAEVAEDAGLPARGFQALVERVAADPVRAFSDLRALLFDVTTSLVGAPDVRAADTRLGRRRRHPLAPLLHHFELPTWILYARAYAPGRLDPDPAVRTLDRALRRAPDALAWLEARWLGPPG